MIHLAFFLYFFAQKILQMAHPLEETRLIRYFQCFKLEVLVINGALTLKAHR